MQQPPRPRRFQILTTSQGDREVELVSISALAIALSRGPETIRMLEARGVLPEAPFRYEKVGGPRQRLYPRAYVEALAASPVAEELRIRRRGINEVLLAEAARVAMAEALYSDAGGA